MPLLITNVVGLVERSEQNRVESALPEPFNQFRAPNLLQFCDRSVTETFPQVSTYFAAWKRTNTEDVARSRLVCLIWILTQVQFRVASLLLSRHDLLNPFDFSQIFQLLAKINSESSAANGTPFWRSRFVAINILKSLEAVGRSLLQTNFPQSWDNLDVDRALKRIHGIGPFYATCINRELINLQFFQFVVDLPDLGKEQGSRAFLEVCGCKDSDLREMVTAFEATARKFWARRLQSVPSCSKYQHAIAKLLFRTPTPFELENMCCEGKKWLKILWCYYQIGSHTGLDKFQLGARSSAPNLSQVPVVLLAHGSSGRPERGNMREWAIAVQVVDLLRPMQ